MYARQVDVGVRDGTLKEGVALKVLLRELGAELSTPLYHHIPSLAAALGIRRPPARCSVFLLYWYSIYLLGTRVQKLTQKAL